LRLFPTQVVLLHYPIIKLLDILRDLYGSITITEEVADEFREKLPNWINVTAVKDSTKTQMLGAVLDLGEASSIALALENKNSLLILDDGKARHIAQCLNITLTGTLGALVKAFRAKLIPNLQDTIILLRQKGFYISKNIENELLKL